ncbi:hypothetical protein AZH53_03795 [Methanomicrobiaceae archaeon CYW5]|nr:hypothetical protein [Methanovulcanius yangii]
MAVIVLVCMLVVVGVTAGTPVTGTDEVEYVAVWGSFAPAGRESVHPYGIAVDADGTVYVNDPGNDRVRVIPLGVDFTPRREYVVRDAMAVRAFVWTVGPAADDDFSTIQDAVDAASAGDTILVTPGTYREDVVVDKALVIDGGRDAAIDGSIILTADGSTLIGLLMGNGVRVASDNNTVEEVLTGWFGGVGGPRESFWVTGSNNTFTNCLVDGCFLGGGGIGVTIDPSVGNTFDGLAIIDSYNGIILRGASATTITDCGSHTRDDGIIMEGSASNTISGCSIQAWDYMFSDGVVLTGSNGNTFANCSIFAAGYGVYLGESWENVFSGCIISSMSCAVYQDLGCSCNQYPWCTVEGQSADWCGYVFFVDANLEDAVREALGIPSGDIFAGDMQTLTALEAPERGIASLAGLEYAAGLQVLGLDTNSVTVLCPLAGLTDLREVVLSNNSIGDLAPLIANSDAGGLGPGDLVDIRYNGLDLTPGSAGMTAIQALEAAGVTVIYEPQEHVPPAPSAAFAADVTEGVAPLTVAFTDLSEGEPEEWFWEFGDGTTSAGQNPVHTYATAGMCTVCLTVTNAGGSDTLVMDDCICVRSPSPPTIDDLITAVEAAGLDKGTCRSLTAKLEAAGRSLEDGNVNGAVGPLEAFIHHVEALKGKKIEEGCADALVECAKGVIEGIS